MTVLVADYYESAREVLKLILETCGYSVLEASNGEAAVRLAKEQLPRLIFMELAMPDVDGFEAIRPLREHDETKDITIVALSAHFSDPECRNKALQSGANDWLTKPPDLGKLLKLLSHGIN